MIASSFVMGSDVTIVTTRPSTPVSSSRRNLSCMARKSAQDLTGFGRRLNMARNRTGKEISHQAIATAAKVSRVAVTKWEAAAAPAIKPDNLFAAADFLGVRARWLATAEGPMEIEIPDAATQLAEDFASLPVEYQAAIRKHTDDLLAALNQFPELHRPIGDARVSQYLKPAPKVAEPMVKAKPSPAGPLRHESKKGHL